MVRWSGFGHGWHVVAERCRCRLGFGAGGDGAAGLLESGGAAGVELVDGGDEAFEGLVAGGLVGGDGVVGVFASAHEAVAGALVGDRLVLLAGGLHGLGGGGDGGVDAHVVAGVEAVDGRGDGGDVGRRGAVEDEGGAEVVARGGEGEGLAAAPAEAGDEELAVGGGDFFAVVGGGVEVGGDLVGGKAGDGFGDGILGHGVGAAAVGADAGEEVGRDDDEALCGELVGHLFGPVAEAEDFVDHDDDGRFGADLGIDDEGLHGAVAMFEGDVLAVARGFFEHRLGPVLREKGSGGGGEKQSDGEDFEGGCAHGGSLDRGKEFGQGSVRLLGEIYGLTKLGV